MYIIAAVSTFIVAKQLMRDAFLETAPAPDERVVPCEIRSNRIVIGQASILEDRLAEPSADPVPVEQREQEIARFREALARGIKAYEERIAHAGASLPV